MTFEQLAIKGLRQEIEARTGVPAYLLTGETAEENIAQAKAMLAYKREREAQKPQPAREQFANWYKAQKGEDPQKDEAAEALDAMEKAIKDGGAAPDPRPTRELFAAWLGVHEGGDNG